ncbi:MAG TPA: type-F conjugative transfer system pilin assembly protein TrbC [Noviherbaspirillum sp.]
MSASNPSLYPARAALLAVVLMTTTACMHDALAQASPVVTDADIERAKRSQPVISDDDMARAQKKHRMPTEGELMRVPVPAAPKLDALPSPSATRAIDLEALAKGYEAHAERMAAAPGIQPGPGLLVFVSFSMPAPTLQRLVDQAAKAQASLVVRGFINGSLRETVARAQGLIGNRQVAFQIDPQAFDRFAVVKTPTFVLVRGGVEGQPCGAGLCVPPDAYVATSGDVSLDYALEFIERTAPRFAKDARRYLKNIRG